MVKLCETIIGEFQKTACAGIGEIVAGARLLDKAGFYALEAVSMPGGRQPMENIKNLRAALKSTKLMIFVGVDDHHRDSLEKTIEKGLESGVDIFRLDPDIKDPKDIKEIAKAVNVAGKHLEATVIVKEKQDIKSIANTAHMLKEWGCKSICLGDFRGIIKPQKAIELITSIKQTVSLPLAMRFFSKTGMAQIVYYAAAINGVDCLYCTLGSNLGGERLPETETIVNALADTEWNTGLKADAFAEANRYFEKRGLNGTRVYDVIVSDKKFHVEVHPSCLRIDKAGTPKTEKTAPSSLARPKPVRPKASQGTAEKKTVPEIKPSKVKAAGGLRNVRSPMEGTIIEIFVKGGDVVKRKGKLLTLEAMKMKNEVLSPFDGAISEILVEAGQTVKDGQDLVRIKI